MFTAIVWILDGQLMHHFEQEYSRTNTTKNGESTNEKNQGAVPRSAGSPVVKNICNEMASACAQYGSEILFDERRRESIQ